MDIIMDKYYKGFEGEPEIQIIHSFLDGRKEILQIWSRYFDNIMNAIKPEPTGWIGLAYYYHLDKGWYDESPWKVEDVGSAIDQLKKIDRTTLDITSQEVLSAICKMFEEVQNVKDTIFISYE